MQSVYAMQMSLNISKLTLERKLMSTPEACNLWFRTLTEFIDWPQITLYFDIHNFTFLLNKLSTYS